MKFLNVISALSNKPYQLSEFDYNFDLYELSGQSNANGVAFADDIQDDLTGIQTGRYIFNNQTLAWELLEAGVNNGGNPTGDVYTGRFGIEMRLMKLLYQWYGRKQYLIKYGKGGISLAQTVGLDWNSASTNEYYAMSNTVHNTAIAGLTNPKPPRAYIWIHGESDTTTDFAPLYQSNLEAFIIAKRTYYGYPTMPFIIVRLGDMQTAYPVEYVNTIRTAQTTVALQPNNYLVSADNLPTSDTIHYTPDSYDTLARRIFEVVKGV